jgi:hypothetical protein
VLVRIRSWSLVFASVSRAGSRGLGCDQIARGLYRWADAPEIDQDLLEIAHRAPRGTLCLVTALAHHGLTDIIPARIDIALPRGSRIPVLRKTIDVHIFSRETFDLGREEFAVGDKRSVGIYSPELNKRPITGPMVRVPPPFPIPNGCPWCRSSRRRARLSLYRTSAHRGGSPRLITSVLRKLASPEDRLRQAVSIAG